jgi:hypothetical protein
MLIRKDFNRLYNSEGRPTDHSTLEEAWQQYIVRFTEEEDGAGSGPSKLWVECFGKKEYAVADGSGGSSAGSGSAALQTRVGRKFDGELGYGWEAEAQFVDEMDAMYPVTKPKSNREQKKQTHEEAKVLGAASAKYCLIINRLQRDGKYNVVLKPNHVSFYALLCANDTSFEDKLPAVNMEIDEANDCLPHWDKYLRSGSRPTWQMDGLPVSKAAAGGRTKGAGSVADQIAGILHARNEQQQEGEEKRRVELKEERREQREEEFRREDRREDKRRADRKEERKEEREEERREEQERRAERKEEQERAERKEERREEQEREPAHKPVNASTPVAAAQAAPATASTCPLGQAMVEVTKYKNEWRTALHARHEDLWPTVKGAAAALLKMLNDEGEETLALAKRINRMAIAFDPPALRSPGGEHERFNALLGCTRGKIAELEKLGAE